jgi:hypothetical protein
LRGIGACQVSHGFGIIAHERFAIALVRCEVREVDQREREIRRAGELGGNQITLQISSATANGLRLAARMGFEIFEFVHIEGVADQQCNHPSLPTGTRVTRVGTDMFHVQMKRDCVDRCIMKP